MPAISDRLATLLVVLGGLLLLAYFSTFATRNWIAHDEGLLGLTARETAAGKLPHRDFEDPYTGGLSYWHAGSFSVFGENVLATRLTLLTASAFFVAAVYAIARHAVGPLPAAGATLLAATWSLPNYFAALPSWYNAFLATFGVLALLRHHATGRVGWIAAAGLCAGLSILVKIVGLYFVAAGLLYLAFVEAERPEARRATGDDDEAATDAAVRGRSWPLLAIKVAGAAAFTLLLILLVRRQARPPEIVHFILPGATLAWTLALLEWRGGGGSTAERLRWLATRVGAFALAAAGPVALFAIPYLASGSLDALVHGVFVAPRARIDRVSMPLPATWTLAWAIPLATLLFLSLRRGPLPRAIDVALAIACGLALAAAVAFGGATASEFYQSVWHAVRPAAPLVALAAAAWLLLRDGSRTETEADDERDAPVEKSAKSRRRGKKSRPTKSVKTAARFTPEEETREERPSADDAWLVDPATRRAGVYLLATTAALTSLVQFPYSHGIYFCYTTPLTTLAALFLIAAAPGAPRVAGATVAAGLALFAVAWLNTGLSQALGVVYVPRPELETLDLPTGQIAVPRDDKAVYETMAAFVEQFSPDGGPIWAGPDCPEVAFLTGRANAATATYDVLSGVSDEERARRIGEELDRSGVKVAIVQPRPEFSDPFSETTLAAFTARFGPPKGRLGRFLAFSRD